MADRRYIAVAGLALVSACAHRNAESLARESLVQVVEYEAELERVADATSRYYTSSLDHLRSDLSVGQGAATGAEINSLAGDATDDAVQVGVSERLLRNFIKESAMRRISDGQALRSSVEALEGEMQGFLERLDTQQKKLESLGGKLERLQTRRTYKDLAKDLAPIVDEVRRAIDEAEDQ